MAIMVISDNPNGTSEQDDLIVKELNLDGLPAKGALFRAAGPHVGGWRIISGWESLEDFEAFRHERLEPLLRKYGREMPEFQVWEVDSFRLARRVE
jgi:hypothetical protein